MVYEWGPRHYGVDPSVVGNTVVKLSEKYGGVCSPDALVQAASRISSPLHKLFTWDNDVAAERWRRQEARVVIDSLRVIHEETGEQVPAFYHIAVTNGDRHEGYAPVSVVIENLDMQAQALEEALRYLQGFQRRYRHLKALATVFEAIEQVKV